MKVVKRTGLVPVLVIKTGVIQGVTPAQARAMLAAKPPEAVLHIPPDWVESYDIAEKVKPEAKAVVEEHAVVIPEDWEGRHHLQRMKLALALGEIVQQEGERKIDAADRMIRDEIQRRAAAGAAQAE